jgi:hypothetical protein
VIFGHAMTLQPSQQIAIPAGLCSSLNSANPHDKRSTVRPIVPGAQRRSSSEMCATPILPQQGHVRSIAHLADAAAMVHK